MMERPPEIEQTKKYPDELPPERTTRQKIKDFIRQIVDYLIRQILLVDLVILGIVIVSFLLFGEFSAVAISERMFWAGMLAMGFGAIAILATGFAGRSFGVPTFIRKPEEAKKLLDKTPEIRVEQEKRYNAGARLWLIGIGCVAISALVEQIFS